MQAKHESNSALYANKRKKKQRIAANSLVVDSDSCARIEASGHFISLFLIFFDV